MSARRKSSNLISNKPFIGIILLVFIFGIITALPFIIKYDHQNNKVLSSETNYQPAEDEPLNIGVSKAPPPSARVISTPHDYVIPPVTNGIAPVLSRIPTSQKVVFLGIDDGENKQPFELQMMKDNHIKASLFLSWLFIQNNPTFFKDFTGAGSLIEDHTIDHILLSTQPYLKQKQEICDEADLFQQIYGRRPVLFRPPGGDYNLNTQIAAAACGMKAVIMWIAKANGGSMQYQIGNQLRPGDIVLMHFRPEFKQDMQAFINAQNKARLHTELLEDWLQT